MPAKSKAPPAFIEPMAAEAVKALPDGEDWLYELKLDGYRALMIKDGSRVQLRSRNDKDLTSFYPSLAAAGANLKTRQFVLDGEVVALGPDGLPSFQALQHRSEHTDHSIKYFAFDVLHLDGQWLTKESLVRRRARLPKILPKGNPLLQISEELPGSMSDVVAAVRATGLEGVVAKCKDSAYQAGERSGAWLKLKFEPQQEFVIGGYRPDGSGGVDALIVGYYDEGGKLKFAGKVRAGMVPHVRRELRQKLEPLQISKCPFANLPDSSSGRWGGGVTAEQMLEMHWTRPKLVAQIRFTQWTSEGRLRLAKYLGLRSDKRAKEVRREA